MKLSQKLIESQLDELDLDLQAEINSSENGETTGEKVKYVFCAHWAEAKKGLELAIMLLKNPIAKWVLGLAILIGDKIKQNICPE